MKISMKKTTKKSKWMKKYLKINHLQLSIKENTRKWISKNLQSNKPHNQFILNRSK